MSKLGKLSEVPTHWYNILEDLPFELPEDLPQETMDDAKAKTVTQLPLELVRQSMSGTREVKIPKAVHDKYCSWRPTPLIRAKRLEEYLKTKTPIYYKYEGGNVSGSHKLCTALAQAYFYSKAGAKRLVTGTGAGQWGTALAVGCQEFGMDCKIYMVGKSFHEKPYRKTIMQLNGASVVASPNLETGHKTPDIDLEPGNIAYAVTEAYFDAVSTPGSRLSVGSGEAYSILHSTLIGIEAKQQLEEDFSVGADIVIGSLGAGSNFGGIAMPFVGANMRGESSVKCITVEPSGCPKLTRGRYCYDYTDGSGRSPIQKMYTLGSTFKTAGNHVGGLRYHACSKLISALYYRGAISAVSHKQSDVFKSAVLFQKLEGILPAPESAHAVHEAIVQATNPENQDKRRVILFCLSGHGLLDLSAYQEYMNQDMQDIHVTDEEIAESLSKVPNISDERVSDLTK